MVNIPDNAVANHAALKFDSMVKDMHAEMVQKNPQLAMQDKLATLAEGSGAFKGVAGSIQVENGANVAAQAVTGVAKDTSRQV